MRSVLEAVDLLPLGAALHECPDLRVVAQNPQAPQAPLDVADAMRRACEGVGEVVPVEADGGWFAVSRLPGGPEVARPDLVLMTYAGSGKSSTFAMLAHRRAVALLTVCEQAYRTTHMLEDALVHIRGALDAQDALVAQLQQIDDEVTAMLVDTPNLGGS